MVTIAQRTYGSAQTPIPAVALGSWHTWDRAGLDGTTEIVKRAADAGAAAFDVAMYHGGPDFDSPDSTTDVILGRAVAAAGLDRDDYTLSVKGWLPPRRTTSFTQQVEATLRRHGTDYADLMVIEAIDHADHYDMDETVVEVGELIDAGMLRHWGVNNWSAAQILAATAAAHRYNVEAPQLAQMVYGLLRRTECEGAAFRDACARTGTSLQASNIFEGGSLLGGGAARAVDVGPSGIRDAMQAAQPVIAAAAASLGATVPQFAFAYPLINPECVNVLVGVRSLAQFDDLLGAFALIERHGAEAIRAAAAPFWLDRDSADAGDR